VNVPLVASAAGDDVVLSVDDDVDALTVYYQSVG